MLALLKKHFWVLYVHKWDIYELGMSRGQAPAPVPGPRPRPRPGPGKVEVAPAPAGAAYFCRGLYRGLAFLPKQKIKVSPKNFICSNSHFSKVGGSLLPKYCPLESWRQIHESLHRIIDALYVAFWNCSTFAAAAQHDKHSNKLKSSMWCGLSLCGITGHLRPKKDWVSANKVLASANPVWSSVDRALTKQTKLRPPLNWVWASVHQV